jgi:flavin-dependent dehydrogenase
VTFFTDGDLLTAKGRDLRRHLARHVDEAPCVSSVIDPESLAPARDIDLDIAINVVASHTVFRMITTGDGWICCGDAAQTYDPLSSFGIAGALRDGIDAAQTILRGLDGDASALAERDVKRRHDFAGYLRTQHRYYRAEGRWPDSPFWKRRHEATQLRRGVEHAQRAIVRSVASTMRTTSCR